MALFDAAENLKTENQFENEPSLRLNDSNLLDDRDLKQ